MAESLLLSRSCYSSGHTSWQKRIIAPLDQWFPRRITLILISSTNIWHLHSIRWYVVYIWSKFSTGRILHFKIQPGPLSPVGDRTHSSANLEQDSAKYERRRPLSRAWYWVLYFALWLRWFIYLVRLTPDCSTHRENTSCRERVKDGKLPKTNQGKIEGRCFIMRVNREGKESTIFYHAAKTITAWRFAFTWKEM